MRRFLALTCLQATLACNATSPSTGTPAGPDAAPVGPDETVELQVDAPPPTTPYASIPLTGHGPASGLVLYDVPGHGQFSKELGADGGFCVDVPLELDAANTIRFQAISATGVYSEIVTVATLQSGTPAGTGDGGGADSFTNVLYASPDIRMHDMHVDQGTKELLVDGDLSAAVALKDAFGEWNSPVLQLKMNRRAKVYNIRVRVPGDCKLRDFDVFLSNADEPSTYPGNDKPDWDRQAQVDDESTDFTIWPPLGEPTAQWLGIEFFNGNCGNLAGGKQKILELEVVSRDPGGQDPVDPDPTCASGGA